MLTVACSLRTVTSRNRYGRYGKCSTWISHTWQKYLRSCSKPPHHLPYTRVPRRLSTTLVSRTRTLLTIGAATAITKLFLESGDPLLLGDGIDVGADDKGDEVEERHPCLLREELLGESEGDGRGCPGDLHDGHEAGADGGADLVGGAGAGDDGHAG